MLSWLSLVPGAVVMGHELIIIGMHKVCFVPYPRKEYPSIYIPRKLCRFGPDKAKRYYEAYVFVISDYALPQTPTPLAARFKLFVLAGYRSCRGE
jgi:hypothetical protein